MLKRGARFLYAPHSSPSWLLTRRYRKPSARQAFRLSPSPRYGQAQPVSSTAGAVRDCSAEVRSADPAGGPIPLGGGGLRRCRSTSPEPGGADRAPEARRPALAPPSRSAPSAAATIPPLELTTGGATPDAPIPEARGFASCLRGGVRKHSRPRENPRGARAPPDALNPVDSGH